MTFGTNLNEAIHYIEDHLTEEICDKELARVANCPIYYFQKMFLYMANITFSEYIRARRLSLAAVDLQKNKEKVLEVALKYGYNSPTAFNRAFKKFHGITPSAVRKGDSAFRSYPPLHFSLSVKGGKELNFRVENKPVFYMLGKSFSISQDIETNFVNVPVMWSAALENGDLSRLLSLNDCVPKGLLGATVHYLEKRKYFIAVASTINDARYDRYTIPSCTWAVFSGQGTNMTLQDLERQVILDWLPTSGYQCVNIPDIELYLQADPSNAVYEYWLPVQ